MSDYNFPERTCTRRGKDVACDWCGTIITRGDKYTSWGQVYDRVVGTLRMHFCCWKDGWKLFTHTDSYGSGKFSLCLMKYGEPEYDDE